MKFKSTRTRQPGCPGPIINLERGVDFESVLSSGNGESDKVTTKYYLYGQHVLKVLWELSNCNIRCHIVEMNDKKIEIVSEWLSVAQIKSILEQKELLRMTIQKTGITVGDDEKEISENIYTRIAGLNKLASMIRD